MMLQILMMAMALVASSWVQVVEAVKRPRLEELGRSGRVYDDRADFNRLISLQKTGNGSPSGLDDDAPSVNPSISMSMPPSPSPSGAKLGLLHLLYDDHSDLQHLISLQKTGNGSGGGGSPSGFDDDVASVNPSTSMSMPPSPSPSGVEREAAKRAHTMEFGHLHLLYDERSDFKGLISLQKTGNGSGGGGGMASGFDDDAPSVNPSISMSMPTSQSPSGVDIVAARRPRTAEFGRLHPPYDDRSDLNRLISLQKTGNGSGGGGGTVGGFDDDFPSVNPTISMSMLTSPSPSGVEIETVKRPLSTEFGRLHLLYDDRSDLKRLISLQKTGNGSGDSVSGLDDDVPFVNPFMSMSMPPSLSPTAPPPPPISAPPKSPQPSSIIPSTAPPTLPPGIPTQRPSSLQPTSASAIPTTLSPVAAPSRQPQKGTVAPTSRTTASPATPAPILPPSAAPVSTSIPPTSGSTTPPTQSPGHTTGAPSTKTTTILTETPTKVATFAPTKSRTSAPTKAPKSAPTKAPTVVPTAAPTNARTKSPTVVPTKVPTNAPSLGQTNAPTRFLTKAPTNGRSNEPTRAPTVAPTKAPVVLTAAPSTSAPTHLLSAVPSAIPSPVLFQQSAVFVCSDEGVVISNTTTPKDALAVEITVGYTVESPVSPSFWQEELEALIVSTAISASLDCNTGGPLFGPNSTVPIVPIETTTTGQHCDQLQSDDVEGDQCIFYTSQFMFLIDDSNVSDPAVAEFLAYVALQQGMDSGTFANASDLILAVDYVSPLPLLPPPSSNQDDAGNNGNPPPLQASDATLTVSPWTVGAVLAMSVGGIFALYAWARNRRTRNQRHMQLLEDMSLGSPDPTGV